MTDDQPTVIFEDRGAVAVITLNRPDQRNAINADMSNALREALDQLEADPNLRVGVLRAEGPTFCAGMDLKVFAKGDAEPVVFGKDRLGGLVSRQRSKPLIAAVQGPALAGGFELVLACDIVIAAQEASFGLPEPKIGLIAGAGGAIRLSTRLPHALAQAMLLTGEPIDAQRAAHHGLVYQVMPASELEAAAQDLASRIAANAPLAVAASLRLAAANREAAEEPLWAQNDAALRTIMATEDAREGASAFASRRKPRWSGH